MFIPGARLLAAAAAALDECDVAHAILLTPSLKLRVAREATIAETIAGALETLAPLERIILGIHITEAGLDERPFVDLTPPARRRVGVLFDVVDDSVSDRVTFHLRLYHDAAASVPIAPTSPLREAFSIAGEDVLDTLRRHNTDRRLNEELTQRARASLLNFDTHLIVAGMDGEMLMPTQLLRQHLSTSIVNGSSQDLIRSAAQLHALLDRLDKSDLPDYASRSIANLRQMAVTVDELAIARRSFEIAAAR